MKSRLRIALVAEHYQPRVGGIELHVQTLAHHLHAAGHDVHIITTYPGPATVDGMRVHRFEVPLLPIWKSAFTPAGIAPVRRLLEQESFDVVHAHTSVYSPAVIATLYMSQYLGLPAVATLHSQLCGYTRAFRVMDRMCGWTQWRVLYTAVSESIATHVGILMSGDPVPVLANGIDAARWRTAPRHAEPHADVSPRARNVAPAGRLRLVTTMRLAPRKRPRALIEIFDAARARLRRGTDVELLIIGDGPERAAIERMITRRGLASHVTLAGAQSHAAIRTAYAVSDVFVLPSIEEAFGIAALEARAAGLPVIAMTESGAASFIRDEQNGLLAATDAAFVSAIVRLAEDNTLRQRIAEHNRIADVPYSWPSVLSAHLDVYAQASRIASGIAHNPPASTAPLPLATA